VNNDSISFPVCPECGNTTLIVFQLFHTMVPSSFVGRHPKFGLILGNNTLPKVVDIEIYEVRCRSCNYHQHVRSEAELFTRFIWAEEYHE
jgi:hypothetical protein